MGNMWVQQYFTAPEVTPRFNSETKFDPLFGFPEGRKQRVMGVTEDEMRSCRLEHEKRDYCADKFIDYLACAARNWPWPVKCGHEKHVYDHCQYQDWILRMKEFEREKRLLRRAKRVPIENAGWKQIAVE